jgi:hypothetical protein
MKIGNYEINKDAIGWVVTRHTYGRRFDVKSQKEVETHGKRDTFHGTLEQALRHALDDGLPDEGVSEILSAILASKQEIINAIKGAKL